MPQLRVWTHDIEQPFFIDRELRNKIVRGIDIKISHYTNLACYGASRLDVIGNQAKESENGVTLGLFKTREPLENIEDALVDWYLKKERSETARKRYESVKALLIKLLDLQDIKIEIDENGSDDRVWYIEKDREGIGHEPVGFLDLASGYRSIIAMIGDMILRLFKTQPETSEPSNLTGIVIIDELDLHLHPKWQQKLPMLLSETFPYIQFVASTHSPIPLLGAPEGSVFLKVQRTAEEGITVVRLEQLEKEIKNLLPNTVLTSDIFDMEHLSAASNKNLSEVDTSDTYQEAKKRMGWEERLEKLKSGDKNLLDELGLGI